MTDDQTLLILLAVSTPLSTLVYPLSLPVDCFQPQELLDLEQQLGPLLPDWHRLALCPPHFRCQMKLDSEKCLEASLVVSQRA